MPSDDDDDQDLSTNPYEDEEGLPVSPHDDRGKHLINELEKANEALALAQKIAQEAVVAAKDYLKNPPDSCDDADR